MKKGGAALTSAGPGVIGAGFALPRVPTGGLYLSAHHFFMGAYVEDARSRAGCISARRVGGSLSDDGDGGEGSEVSKGLEEWTEVGFEELVLSGMRRLSAGVGDGGFGGEFRRGGSAGLSRRSARSGRSAPDARSGRDNPAERLTGLAGVAADGHHALLPEAGNTLHHVSMGPPAYEAPEGPTSPTRQPTRREQPTGGACFKHLRRTVPRRVIGRDERTVEGQRHRAASIGPANITAADINRGASLGRAITP